MGIDPLLAKVSSDVRKVDNDTKEGGRNKLGSYSLVDTKGFPLLFNIYGQYPWTEYKVAPNRNTDYNALSQGLCNVKLHMLGNNLKTLGLPLIGCGLAGGDWEGVVLPMIKELFDSSGIGVTIFIL